MATAPADNGEAPTEPAEVIEKKSASVLLNTDGKLTLSITPDSPVAYAVVDANGVATLVTEEPADNYVKLAYDENNVPTVYLKNAALKGTSYNGVITLNAATKKVVVLGDSKITAVKSAEVTDVSAIGNSGADIVIEGPGKLTIVTDSNGVRIFSSGTITIEENANIEVDRTGALWSFISSGGSFVNKGKIVDKLGNGVASIQVKSFTMESGSLEIHYEEYNANNRGIQATDFTVNGGLLSITAKKASGSYGINATNVTLNGGSVYTNTGRGIVASGAVVINGGAHNFENNFDAAVITVAGTVTVNGGDVTITASASDKAALTNAAIKLPTSGEYIAKLGESRDGTGATSVTGTAAANDKKYCYFHFANAVNEFTQAPSIEGWTAGETPKTPAADAKFGDVVFYYAAPNGTYSTAVPTEAGVYFMVAVVAQGTKDIEGTELAYAQIISEPVRFVIKAAASTEPDPSTPGATTPSTPGATTPSTPGATTPEASTPGATTPATPVPPTGDTFNPMVIVLVLASVAALAVLTLNRKKFI